MPVKKDKAKKSSGVEFAGIPLGGALDIVEGVGGILADYLAKKYEVEKKVEAIKEETTEKVEEIRVGAVKTGYALKKALFKTIFEAVMLTTGLLSLVIGCILLLKNIVPLEYVLVGYGFLITLYVVFTMKTSPDI